MNNLISIFPEFKCSICECVYSLGRYAAIKDNHCPCCDNEKDLILIAREVWKN